MHLLKVIKIIFILAIIIIATSNISLAKRGCCSWHGGVVGCDTRIGKQVCRDGTYSPSCTCEKEKSHYNERNKNSMLSE